MGECGCGEMNIIDSFLVGNKVIAVDFYRGCRYCGADIGIRLHVLTKKDALYWDIKPKDTFKPSKIEPIFRDIFRLGMEDIIKAISNYRNEISDYQELEDFLEDRKHDILEDALKFAESNNK